MTLRLRQTIIIKDRHRAFKGRVVVPFTTLSFLMGVLICRGCASITTLTGGPENVSHPEPVSFPVMKNIPGTEKYQIKITYRDFIAQKKNEPVVFSPFPGTTRMKVIGKELTIEIEGTPDSATYTVCPYHSIVDYRNGLPDTSCFVFSAHGKRDTCFVCVKFQNSAGGKIPPSAFVLTVDTFHTPFYPEIKKGTYYGLVKDGGCIRNMKCIPHGITAFHDKNDNLRYDAGELVSFSTQKIINDTVYLSFFEDSLISPYVSSIYVVRNSVFLLFNVSINTLNLWFSPSPLLIDTLSPYSLVAVYDSINPYIRVCPVRDSSACFNINLKKIKKTPLSLKATITDDGLIEIKSNFPLFSVDTSLVFLVVEQGSGKDTLTTRLLKQDKYALLLKGDVKEGTVFFLPSALRFIDRHQNTDTIKLPLIGEVSGYAMLTINARNCRESPSIVEIFENDGEGRYHLCLHSDTILKMKIREGAYSILKALDENLNCIRDNGYLATLRPPETAKKIKSITLKAGWTYEEVIDCKK